MKISLKKVISFMWSHFIHLCTVVSCDWFHVWIKLQSFGIYRFDVYLRFVSSMLSNFNYLTTLISSFGCALFFQLPFFFLFFQLPFSFSLFPTSLFFSLFPTSLFFLPFPLPFHFFHLGNLSWKFVNPPTFPWHYLGN